MFTVKDLEAEFNKIKIKSFNDLCKKLGNFQEKYETQHGF